MRVGWRPWWQRALDRVIPSRRRIAREWRERDRQGLIQAIKGGVPDLDVTATRTGGTFTITFGGETTEAIPHDASASGVKIALLRTDPEEFEKVFGPPLVRSDDLLDRISKANDEMIFEGLKDMPSFGAAIGIEEDIGFGLRPMRYDVVTARSPRPFAGVDFGRLVDHGSPDFDLDRSDSRRDSVLALVMNYYRPKPRLYMGRSVDSVIEALREEA